jgi:hypothetical protein
VEVQRLEKYRRRQDRGILGNVNAILLKRNEKGCVTG